MISNTKLLLILILLTSIFNCKKEKKIEIAYQFSDKPYSFTCEASDIDQTLLKEALYAFEDDILKYYDPRNSNLNRAYGQFLLATNNKQYIHNRIISPRSRTILERLKQEPKLFKNGELNANNALVQCIAKNIEDKDLKATFNALLEAGSLKSNILASGIMYESKKVLADKSLATFVALDMYYAKIAEKDKEKLEKVQHE